MERAISTVSNLKFGCNWISSKAKEELSSISGDLSTFSSSVEEKAKYLFDKLKGKPLRSLPDLLRLHNLPSGLFPVDITGYEFDELNGKLFVHLASPCEVTFKDTSVVRYAARVKGILLRGKLTGIEGMKTKLLVWVKVQRVALEGDKSNKLCFVTGVTSTSRPKSVFASPQVAVRVRDF